MIFALDVVQTFLLRFLIRLKERREGKMYSGAQKDTKGIDEICKVDC